MNSYDPAFYQRHLEAARRSAEVVVPLVLAWVQPASVVDVGCGAGAWLSVFAQHGVSRILGIDGDWVDRRLLQIPESCFLPRDLSEPIEVGDRFDLVTSLEVAEHLPAERSEAFVDCLVDLGQVVLFSAAIPEQGGRHHVNEQWPVYWERRFMERGYVALDCLRPRIWDNPQVEWYYAQNMLLFVQREHLKRSPHLLALQPGESSPRGLVHPRLFLSKLGELREWVAQLQRFAEDLAAHVPAGETMLLADEGSFGKLATAGFQVIPFPERNGVYSGPPPDDATAIREFERMRAAGARYFVLGWPAFWWLDHYSGLAQHLQQKFPSILHNDRALIFDLRQAR